MPDPARPGADPVVIDSRAAGPGALFAALPGERVDGHDFAAAAVAAGAVAVLATRPAGVPALVVPDVQAALAALARAVVDRLPGLTIAGITGSAGKTTTKDLLAQLAERLGPTVAPSGSFNNEIGHPLTVLRHRRDPVPGAGAGRPRPRPHRAAVRDRAAPSGHRAERRPGPRRRSSAARPRWRRPRASWSRRCPPAAWPLLNADDPRVLAMAARTAARVVTFGRGPAGGRAGRGRPARRRGPAGDSRWSRRPARRRCGCGCSASTTCPTRWPRRRWRARSAWPCRQVADGLSAAVARSRWRMEVTRRPDGVHGDQRRLQRQPGVDGRGDRGAGLMARGGGAFAVLGPMAELGGQSPRLARGGGRARRAGRRQPASSSSGRRRRRCWPGPRPSGPGTGELLQVPDGPAAAAALAAPARARATWCWSRRPDCGRRWNGSRWR